MQYIATINTPGYLPDSDDLAIFDTAAEAWAYLADERNRHIDETYDGEADPDGDPWNDDDTLDALGAYATQAVPAHTLGLAADYTGTITGPTPGYEGDHDLGKAYTVTAREGVTCVDCGAVFADTATAQAHWDQEHDR